MVELTDEQYATLVTCAFKSPTDLQRLSLFVADIDRANGKARYMLFVRWQEVGKVLPPGMQFPASWPEMQSADLIQYTPITAADVTALLDARASNPVGVMVTEDPLKRVGWTEFDAYFNR